MKKFLLFLCAILLVFGVTGSATHATSLTFDLGYEYTGAFQPSGTAPWLTAIFDDDNSLGTVTLTLRDNSLIGGEHVKVWLFNLDPDLDLDNIEETTNTGASIYFNPGPKDYHAAGDGYFDIKFAWSTNIFGPGLVDSPVFDISGDGLTAASFDFLSSGGNPDKGGLPTAAHIGGIGPDNEKSGWVTVHEPATMLLLGSGLIGLGVLGRKKLFKR